MDANVFAVGFFLVFPLRGNEVEEFFGRFLMGLLNLVGVEFCVERGFTEVVEEVFPAVRFERGETFDQGQDVVKRAFVDKPCPRGFAFY